MVLTKLQKSNISINMIFEVTHDTKSKIHTYLARKFSILSIDRNIYVFIGYDKYSNTVNRLL